MPRRSEQAANKQVDADQELIERLLNWFEANARDLPWRRSGKAGKRDPYITLVSELMLQQTQVSRVLEKFEPFLRRFPTIESLANAPETAVLAAWSGLGYYRRARLLHAAAKKVQSDFGGTLPGPVESLLTIPGIGRYTAGAISSLAFGNGTPLVDGNVTRVLLRISARPGKLGDKATDVWAWEKARELVESLPDAMQAGAWNEGLMELGATVCTPLGPRCSECPVRECCRAHAQGLVNSIPAPKDTKPREKRYWASILFVDLDGNVFLHTRPNEGLFAGLDEVPTLETLKRRSAEQILAFAQSIGGEETRLTRLGTLRHRLTHREIICTVYGADDFSEDLAGNGRWVTRRNAAKAALSNIQRNILELAGVLKGKQARKRPS